MKKNFKLKAEEIVQLIPEMGGCFATDMITVEGKKVDYMYRSEPCNEIDCGWRFFAGEETQEYVDDPNNTMVYSVNTIANYDPAIIPYLNLPVGVELERKRGTDVFDLLAG